MNTVKLMIGACILLNSINLHAESAKECMKYWDEKPVVSIKKMGEVECEHIWDYGKSNTSQNRLKLLSQLNLKSKNNQWMSTGNCAKVVYNKNNYYIYRAYYKEDKDEIWIAYNNKNAFSYFRKVATPQKENESSRVELSCAKSGDYEEAKTVLNSYLKNNTLVNMSFYKVGDWYKEN
ncbi:MULTISPECIES: hypothetical protein [Acinetobacter]|uniref:hypothetical protein n=1 Tax=Acinetobacter TaxID=469 RepID=UPI00029DEFF1|nr:MULTISPECIES: hypothetical protein [Acinetobacter]EKU57420.1 hypothetical protein ACINWC323_3734 [Acinetobacter sp. WC-323]MDH0720628.1 hypothetical protein [Acinetobacter junii]